MDSYGSFLATAQDGRHPALCRRSTDHRRAQGTCRRQARPPARPAPDASPEGAAGRSIIRSTWAGTCQGARTRLTLAGRPLHTIVGINFPPHRHGVSVMLMSLRDRVVVSFHGDAELTGLDDLSRLWPASLCEPAVQPVAVGER
ncbi:DUF1298 domain-containing protein [Nonomuraea basaltis]|nr:DUF1298 domain-containing protein [Nonomuraea basaltis]